MSTIKSKLLFVILVISLSATVGSAQDTSSTTPAVSPAPATAPGPDPALSMNQILDKIIQREAIVASKMRAFHPLVETYLQELEHDDELAFTPAADHYFLGKLHLGTQVTDRSLLDQGSKAWAVPLPSKICTQ